MECDNCGKKLIQEMEIEHSNWISEYFCSPNCAINRYFNYMRSSPVEATEKVKLLGKVEF